MKRIKFLRQQIAVFLFFLATMMLVSFYPSPEADAKKQAAKNYQSEFVATTVHSSDELKWTGDVESCKAGTLAPEIYQKIMRRVNYFRALAGVHNQIQLDSNHAPAQAAALLMYANNTLTHDPTPDMRCFSKLAEFGAGSNLSYGSSVYETFVVGQVADEGRSNEAVGHRRWILNADARLLRFGATPTTYALDVFSNYSWNAVPVVIPETYGYPGKGYIPYQLVFKRWSFSISGEGNFEDAVITVTKNGQPITVANQTWDNAYGDCSLIWEMDDLFDEYVYGVDGSKKRDVFSKLGWLNTPITVTITNVEVGEQKKTYTYNVIPFDPSEK
ncbi:MAG: hypothetical protein ACRCYO_15785 [Bacteroidia bacterium]